MTKARRRRARPATRKTTARAHAESTAKPAKTSKTAPASEPAPPPTVAPEGPTLRSQAQLEIRLGRGARPLTATEQAARLASAQMERRIGRLLSRRVKLKFR